MAIEKLKMKKIFYEKIGRRYHPISEYNSEWIDSYREGTHLVVCQPGITTRRYNIDSNYAALIAAGIVAEDAMARALVKAGELRLQRHDRERKLTEKQHRAWENLVEAFGDSARQLEWPSAQEVAEEGVKALIEEADKLMTHPAVRNAYEQFIMVCELTKQKETK